MTYNDTICQWRNTHRESLGFRIGQDNVVSEAEAVSLVITGKACGTDLVSTMMDTWAVRVGIVYISLFMTRRRPGRI